MAEQLPNNDPDLKLARQIGDARATGNSLAGLNDSLIEELLQYKQTKYQSFRAKSSDKQALWKKIETATSSSPETTATSFPNASTLRWAAAAILLIGAIFSFVYLQFYQQPELVAQSKTSIETVKLPDGSTVTLRPHSRLYSIDKETTSLFYKLEGEGLFQVTESPNRTFSVRTENGRVSVLGTKFTISSWGNQMQVYLQEGSLKVEALEQDSSVVLKAGQSATVNSPTDIPEIQTAKVEEFTDWLDQQLIFENKLARQITSELEQQFNISIVLPDQTANTSLSGRLSLNTLQTSLNDLELVLGGEFTKTGTRKYRFKSN